MIDSSLFNTVVDTAELSDNRLSVVLIREPDSPLLGRVYRELIVANFTNHNDLDSLASIQRYMKDAECLSGHCIAYCCVAITDLFDRILGTTLFGIFRSGQNGFIKGEYTSVNPQVKQQGILQLLLKNRICIADEECRNRGLTLGFAVIQVSANHNESPNHNLQRLWRFNGFTRIDFPFVQLPLRDELESIREFDLFFHPISQEFRLRSWLKCAEMVDIVDACLTFRDSSKELQEYVEYHQMQRYIQTQKRIMLCR